MGDPTRSRQRILFVDPDDDSAAALHVLLVEAAPDAFSVVAVPTIAAALSTPDPAECAIVAVDALDDTALADLALLIGLAPSRAILMLTNEDDDDRCALAMAAGATECLPRHLLTGRGLVRAIRNAIVRKRLETSLAEAQAIAGVGSWELDLVTRELTCSAELCRIFDLPGNPHPTMEAIIARIHPDDRDAGVLAIGQAVEAVSGFMADHRLLLSDGSVRWVSTRGRVERDADGLAARIHATAQDVTDQKLAAKLLRHRAFRDPLTGLPNRLAAVHRLANALDRLDATTSVVGVVYLDIDSFQSVNDRLGHAVGDQLLVAVAERLAQLIRPGDVLAHVDGDEFVVVCEALPTVHDVVALADGLREAMAEPIGWKEGAVTLTMSAGVAVAASATTDPELLLRDATAAVYRAKVDGRARTAVFDASVRATTLERLETEAALRQSIVDGDLLLHFQPIVSLLDGRTVGHEALVRWEHPQRGMLPPDQFISLAEETGLIVPLGAWVLREACRHAVSFQQLDPAFRELTMSVNLSGGQLVQSDLVAMVAEVIHESRLAPEHLQLEMTESVLMDDAASAGHVLRNLKALGVRLAIDDFGTGFSSLAYLKRFPFDLIKIDRSFVSGLGEDLEDAAIVATVMSLADALGMAVVAEGVETPLQRDCLIDVGCERAQGYLFARPVDAMAAEGGLRASLAAGPAADRWAVAAGMTRRSQEEPAARERQLREAIAGGELRCVLQPIVDLASGAVEGVDATLRWSHPTLGLVEPKQLIPRELAAELVPALDNWLLDAAQRAIAADGPLQGLTVSVATSAHDLSEPDFAERTLRALRRLGLHPTTLALVVTESAALAGISDVESNVRTLRRMGVAVHVDDFGIGYSSSSYLHHLPVDAIKIDRSFVHALPGDKNAEAIIASITATARSLGLVTIAVDVDTAEQAAALTILGVDRGQGRAFREPSLAAEVASWMREEPARGSAAGGSSTMIRTRARTTTAIRSTVDPEAAQVRLAAGRALLRIESVEEAVGVCTALVRELGGWMIPARLDDGTALPIDCSFGHGEPLLPLTDSALGRMRLEQLLPEFLDDARTAIVKIRHHDELDHEARTDPLTGTLNRRAMDQVLAAMKPADAVVLVDLDNFKAVNDEWGHATGDEVLIAFARALRDRSRAGDHFARVGGDELMAVIADATEDAIAAFLGRLRASWTASRPHDITYSAGVAWRGTRTVAETMAAADQALYSAKREGRDRVVISA